MMQFYKKKVFGTLIDTFGFSKIYGTYCFKNYILINGFLPFLMAVTFIVGLREFFGQLLIIGTNGRKFYFEQYSEENSGLLAAAAVIVSLLFSVLIILNLFFPGFYLKLATEGKLKYLGSTFILMIICNHSRTDFHQETNITEIESIGSHE